MKRTTITILSLLFSIFAHADLKLVENESQIKFISVKNNAVGEMHHFTTLSGEVLKNGNASISIHLSSVETGIPIRNERMNKFLFEVSKYPLAAVQAQVDYKALTSLPSGSLLEQSLPITLDLHGQSKSFSAEVNIVKLENDQILVQSKSPILLQAADFMLEDGIAELQKIAGLNSIDTVVPVDLSLKFALAK